VSSDECLRRHCGSIDLLRNFGEACRAEFESLQAAAP
jgi:hypothetical protein